MRERFSDPHIQAFLAAQEVVVLATIRPSGAPLAMPLWFLHDPRGFTMISEADTQKVRNLRGDPRVCVAAEGGTRPNVRGVVVEGRAVLLEESAERRALVRALLGKYHPDLERRWGGAAMPPDRVLFRVVAARVRSWGLVVP